MDIDPKFVGTAINKYKTRITWRQMTNYAASIKDSNIFYLNDEREGGLVAHPMFPVAINWPIIENIAEFIDDKTFPSNVLSTGVHYTEHLILHRLIKPKDRVTLTGQIAAILPHRAGSHFIGEFNAIDKKGNSIYTEYSGMMLRGVNCLKEGNSLSDMPIPPTLKSELWQETPLWIHSEYIYPWLPFVYDGCTNIVFPIHTSQKFAHLMKLPGIILQGTATLAIAVSKMIEKESKGDPTRVKEIYCQFTGMVLPETEIKIQLVHRRLKDEETWLFFNVLNGEGKKAISNGFIRLNATEL